MRTEVFKLQIKKLEEVFSMFDGKDEMALRDYFDLDRVLYLNAATLYLDYMECFFPSMYNERQERRRSQREDTHRSVMSLEDFAKDSSLIGAGDELQDRHAHVESSSDPVCRWSAYKVVSVHLTKEFCERLDVVDALAHSPLIPPQIQKRIQEFSNLMMENVDRVKTVLNYSRPILRQMYPTEAELEKFDPTWINNQYVEQMRPLHSSARAILVEIERYLQVERILGE